MSTAPAGSDHLTGFLTCVCRSEEDIYMLGAFLEDLGYAMRKVDESFDEPDMFLQYLTDTEQQFSSRCFVCSLPDEAFAICVRPDSVSDRENISQEFNIYEAGQIPGSEAYTV